MRGAMVLDLARRHPGEAIAVAVAGLLRLVWVTVATATSPDPYSDPSEYISMAQGFGRGQLPTFHGLEPTAWFSPGYPAVLAPFLWLTEHTGIASPAYTASLVNAVAGTATVALVAGLARTWVSSRAGVVAAGLLAISPGQIMFCSTAHSETVFTFLVVAGVLGGSALYRREGPARVPVAGSVALGVLVGFTGLTRMPGLVVLAVPLLVLGRRHVRLALQATLLVVAGTLLCLVPWTIRNGVQVGHWSPGSTANAVALCLGHHPDFESDPARFEATEAVQRDCFSGSPYDDVRLGLLPEGWRSEGPDEARWYRETTRRGVQYALDDPIAEVGRSARKLDVLLRSEAGVVDAARNFSDGTWAGGWKPWLQGAANVWLWVVEALVVVGLVRSRAVRRASVVWVVALLSLVFPMIAIAYPHQHHTTVALATVLAAGGVLALWEGGPRSAPRPIDPDVSPVVAAGR